MIGHLGARVSALLDGQMSPTEAEDAWNHVYACHQCRDLVEREGWVKTRLAGLTAPDDDPACTSALKGSLMSLTPGAATCAPGPRRASGSGMHPGIALVGGSALGAALIGMLALGALPGGQSDPQPPAARIDTASSASSAPTAMSAAPTPTAPSLLTGERRIGRAHPGGLPYALDAFFG